MDLVLFGASLFFLFIATLHYLLFLVYQNDLVSKVARASLWLAFAGQTLFFAARFLMGGVPLATNLYESLVFFSWALVLVFILFSLRFRYPVFGAFILPIAFILQASAAFFAGTASLALPPALQSMWLPFHIGTSFLGDAFFAVAFATGIMYLLQERGLKSKRPGAFYYRLPSLDTLDAINYRSLTVGFPLLTLGIITGSVWAEEAWGAYWTWDSKEVWSLITWFIYAAVLHARMTAGWRGRRAAILSIIGFAAVLFTFLGVGLLLPGPHSYIKGN
jgi:cytochrome c-type biogenesis protein CcsB